MTLTSAQVEFYQQQGFLSPLTVFDPATAATHREQFDVLEAEVGPEKAAIGLIDWHFQRKFIWDIATDSLILDAVEALIGPNILLLATHFFCKYGGDGNKFVAWHQDVTFWGLEPPLAITAWYAIDDSDVENGAMRVIPGTHVQGILEHGQAAQAGNLLSINQEVTVSPEQEAKAIDIELKAGQMSLHDGTLIHGSLPNNTRRRRCGLTLRYIPTSVQQTGNNSHRSRWQTILVRGENPEGHFKPHPAPF